MTTFEPNRSRANGLAVLLWAIVAAIMVGLFWTQIGRLDFGDPDDALRMVQVRDLLAGQAWFDTTQFRINPADGGGDIHWSRFIDVQIAALILFFGLFLDQAAAETWAATSYPLLLLLLLFVLMARILHRLGDARFVRVGLVVTATTVTYLHYFVPLRIDHHNWQMLLSLAMLWLALGPASVVRGLMASLVIALHLEISLEGLPYLVMFGALYAWEWVRSPREAPRLFGFAVGLATLAPLWVLLMRGPRGVLGVYCDAFSWPYLVGASATGLLVALAAQAPVMQGKPLYRLAALAVAGLVGGALFALAAPQCLAGPFAGLDPLVREYWYKQVSEGHPLWTQSAGAAALFGLPALFGLMAIVWNLRQPATQPWAAQWQRLALVSVASFILSLFVLRTAMVTHAFLVPAFVLPFLTYQCWARGRTSALVRIPASAATALFLPASLGGLASLAVEAALPAQTGPNTPRCLSAPTVQKLAKLPPTTIFAALDIAPTLLAHTAHSVTATGHHRNSDAIYTSLAVQMAPPEQAEAMVRASGATLVALCRDSSGLPLMRRAAPDGLAAALYRGATVSWLVREPALGSKQLMVYRVAPAAPATPE